MPICHLYSSNPVMTDSFILLVPSGEESDHKLSQLFQTEFTGECGCSIRTRWGEIERSLALVKWMVKESLSPLAQKLVTRRILIKYIVKT